MEVDQCVCQNQRPLDASFKDQSAKVYHNRHPTAGIWSPLPDVDKCGTVDEGRQSFVFLRTL